MYTYTYTKILFMEVLLCIASAMETANASRQRACLGSCLPIVWNNSVKSMQGPAELHRLWLTRLCCMSSKMLKLFCKMLYCALVLFKMFKVDVYMVFFSLRDGGESLSHDSSWDHLTWLCCQEPQCHASFGQSNGQDFELRGKDENQTVSRSGIRGIQ